MADLAVSIARSSAERVHPRYIQSKNRLDVPENFGSDQDNLDRRFRLTSQIINPQSNRIKAESDM